MGLDIIKMEGGSKDNAIPRLSVAEVLISAEDAEKFAEEDKKRKEEVEEEEIFEEDAPLADVPETGDNSVILIIAIIATAILFGATFIVDKKRAAIK